jgi:hypothetical protein
MAVVRRQRGENVVVCGDKLKANHRLAERIEAAVWRYLQTASKDSSPKEFASHDTPTPIETGTGHETES